MLRKNIVAALLILFMASCGASDNATEPPTQQKQEERADKKVEAKTVQSATPKSTPQETTRENITPDSLAAKFVGEAILFEGFDLRVLDYFVTDKYVYADYIDYDGSINPPEVLSKAGKFVVVNYSVRNTGPGPVDTALSANFNTSSGETYQESDDAEHPNSGGYGIDLPPRGVAVGQFIFDVPTDVEPKTITAGIGLYGEFDSQPVEIDLTQQKLPGAEPDEVLALQYEYTNMFAWEQAYNLFGQQSKDQVSLQQYEDSMGDGDPVSITDYSFPSVKIQGEQATVQRVLKFSTVEGDAQGQSTQQLVLEDEGWRVVMRSDQVQQFTGQPESTTEESTATEFK